MPVSLTPVILALALFAQAERPAVAIRLVRPDIQLERGIAMFEGSRAPDPASALAAWKRATEGGGLGKGPEAAIAALNPRMVAELKILDGAGLIVDIDSRSGQPRWAFCVPRDDGTFSAFATAMALTDGAGEEDQNGADVDRLGPPGSALMARSGSSVVIGGSRPDLDRGLSWLKMHHAAVEGPGRPAPSRLDFAIDSRGLARSRSLTVRRLGEAMLGLGWILSDGSAGIAGDRSVSIGLYPVPTDRRSTPEPELDPAWLDGLPRSASISFSTALDTRRERLDILFQAVDRVEKADAARAKLAPVRVRLNLLARAAGLDLEADLWPKLQGVSGFLLGEADRPRAMALALHATDAASAARWREDFLPRLAKSLRLDPAPVSAGWTPLGLVAGRPLSVWNGTDSTVWLTWGGDANLAIAEASRDQDKSRRGGAAGRGEGESVSRLAWIQPSRLGLAPPGSPLAEALAQAPEIVWTGGNRETAPYELIRCGDLRPVIRRFLECLPLEPAPATGR